MENNEGKENEAQRLMARAKVKSRIVWVSLGVILTVLVMYVSSAVSPIVKEVQAARAKVAAAKSEAKPVSAPLPIVIVPDKPSSAVSKVEPAKAAQKETLSVQNEVVANLAKAIIDKDKENAALKVELDKAKAEGDALKAEVAKLRKDFDALSKSVMIAPTRMPAQPALVMVSTWDASPQTDAVDLSKFVSHPFAAGKKSCEVSTEQLMAGVAVSATPGLRIKVKFSQDRGSWSDWGGQTTDLAAVIRDGKIVLPFTSDRVQWVQFYCKDQPIVVAVMKQ
ncbi:MAG: septum formation initiator family protein [Candidatus Paceibacterota bacterium]|jgi:hypothetical protein